MDLSRTDARGPFDGLADDDAPEHLLRGLLSNLSELTEAPAASTRDAAEGLPRDEEPSAPAPAEATPAPPAREAPTDPEPARGEQPQEATPTPRPDPWKRALTPPWEAAVGATAAVPAANGGAKATAPSEAPPSRNDVLAGVLAAHEADASTGSTAGGLEPTEGTQRHGGSDADADAENLDAAGIRTGAAEEAEDGDDLPVVSGGPGGPRGPRASHRANGHQLPWRALTAGVLAFVLVSCTAAGALLLHGRNTIEQTAIEGVTTEKGRLLMMPGGETIEVMNVLLVGSDDRENLTAEERALVAPDEFTGRRPDTVMLAQLQVGGDGAAALLSIPRDLRVELCDGSTDKLNASFNAGRRAGIGEESCLVKTVTALTGVEIDHYVEVDFAGFLRVIEALGGVTMYLDQPMVDSKALLNLPAGCVTLTPEQSLGFVRSRGYDDDFGRIARQQRFVRETIEEATRVGILANPARVVPLVDRVARAVRTDDGLGISEMRSLAGGLRTMSSSRVLAHTVPGDHAMIGGVAYVEQIEDEAQPLFASFRDGSVLHPVEDEPVVEPSPEPDALTPDRVHALVVENATGTSGLAAKAAELLEAKGFRVAEVGNAETDAPEATEVVHGSGLEEEAALVAETLGGVATRHEGGGAPLTVVLGADLDHETLDALIASVEASEEVEPEEPEAAPAPPAEPTPERTFRGAEPSERSC